MLGNITLAGWETSIGVALERHGRIHAALSWMESRRYRCYENGKSSYRLLSSYISAGQRNNWGDERGKNFVGLHHFGIWVDDIDTMKQAIEAHGGKCHPGPTGHSPANAEHKFRDPYGIVFDISSHGWDGAEP